MLSTTEDAKGLLRRRWVGFAVAFAVLVTAGTLVTGTRASAATPRSESAVQVQQAARAAGICRQVTTFRVPVYTSPTGSDIYGYWFVGTTFTDFGQVGALGRHLNWWPGNVPPSQGVPAYIPHEGTTAVSCPW